MSEDEREKWLRPWFDLLPQAVKYYETDPIVDYSTGKRETVNGWDAAQIVYNIAHNYEPQRGICSHRSDRRFDRLAQMLKRHNCIEFRGGEWQLETEFNYCVQEVMGSLIGVSSEQKTV